jgi:LysR family transcriptional regulator, glycine cleavage system transcriptional activator
LKKKNYLGKLLTMRTLSNLKAIQAFEAAARNQSYVGAAQELHVTPAAVGQQVRSLEAWLGKPLFLRLDTGSQRLVLTADAQAAVADFRDGLDKLDRGLRRLRESRADSVVTVSASQAFVAKWLMPRLDGFTSMHANLDIRLDVTDRLVDLAHGVADVAVRCGAGHWPGLRAVKLMQEEVFPVCHPTLLTGKSSLSQPADLLRQTLIHDMATKDYEGFPSWSDWLEHAGVQSRTKPRGLEINASGMVIQAAINAQGIALARGVLVRDDLSAGRLVRLFTNVRYPTQWAYYLVYAPEREHATQVKAFRDWITQLTK